MKPVIFLRSVKRKSLGLVLFSFSLNPIAEAQSYGFLRQGQAIIESTCMKKVGKHFYLDKQVNAVPSFTKELYILKLDDQLNAVDSCFVSNHFAINENVHLVQEMKVYQGEIWISFQTEVLNSNGNGSLYKAYLYRTDTTLSHGRLYAISSIGDTSSILRTAIGTFSFTNDSLILLLSTVGNTASQQIQVRDATDLSVKFFSTVPIYLFHAEYLKILKGRFFLGGRGWPWWYPGAVIISIDSTLSSAVDTIFLSGRNSSNGGGVGPLYSISESIDDPRLKYMGEWIAMNGSGQMLVNDNILMLGTFNQDSTYNTFSDSICLRPSREHFSISPLIEHGTSAHTSNQEVVTAQTDVALWAITYSTGNFGATTRIVAHDSLLSSRILNYRLRTPYLSSVREVLVDETDELYLLTSIQRDSSAFSQWPFHLHTAIQHFSLWNPPIHLVEIEEKLAIPFTLYPNPANEKVFIHWSTEPKGELKYTLQSTSGQTLQSGWYQPSEGIDCSRLAAGVYQLMLWANGQPIGTERLVVE